MNWTHDAYELTDDSAQVDLDAVCRLLWATYWAATRSRDIIARSLRHSLNFSLFHGGRQVGYARVITDHATHGYLCDVVIDDEHRGRGVGKWVLGRILDHPSLATSRVDLFTKDAGDFYRQFGFHPHAFECLVRYAPGYAGGVNPTAGTDRQAGAP